MNALVIGAGNIGLGFLGYLLWKSGQYSITFLETSLDRVAVLNKERAYTVLTVSNSGLTEEMVCPVKAISSLDRNEIIDAVVDADLILTAVGKQNLVHIALSLGAGLCERIKKRPRAELHLTLIACENVYDNTRYLEKLIFENVPKKYSKIMRDTMSFPCCMVDRIVPLIPKEIAQKYPLVVAVEDFFQFVVDGMALKASFPHIDGIEISSHLSAQLEQKLFTLNMLHGIVGYWGHLVGYEYVHEAMIDKTISALARGALREVGEVIVQRYPSIGIESQLLYGEKIMKRFQNHNLKDHIRRVALQPIRKLGGDERLVKPARLIFDSGRVPAHLATGIAAAFRYQESTDLQSLELAREISAHGIESTLQSVAGLSPKDPLFHLLKADYLLASL